MGISAGGSMCPSVAVLAVLLTPVPCLPTHQFPFWVISACGSPPSACFPTHSWGRGAFLGRGHFIPVACGDA